MDPLIPAQLADHAPDAAAALDRVVAEARAAVSPADFALCRRRIAALHGWTGDPNAGAPPLRPEQVAELDRWWDSDAFDARERALLGFVEQFVFSVSSMTDDHVDALLATDDPIHVHEIANVVWALDLVTRANVVAGKVLA